MRLASGEKPKPFRVVTSIGVKPKVKFQWPREAFWLYGVVEPLTGWQWTQEHSFPQQRELSMLSQRPIACS